MDERTLGLLEIVFFKVGLEGPRTLTVKPSRASGRHQYRDVVVEGHQPLASLDAVAAGLVEWLQKYQGRNYKYRDFNYEIGTLTEDEDGLKSRITFTGCDGMDLRSENRMPRPE